MTTLWRHFRHQVFGVCDWDGCRCRICRLPRDTGHEWEGCKCQRCPQTRHEWEDCHCRRCGGERHEWRGLICRSCGAHKNLASILHNHFPGDPLAIEQVLAKLNDMEDLDWSTIYDWQVVELTRSVIQCRQDGADYEIQVASACLYSSAEERGDSTSLRASAESSGYVVPSALRLRRRDRAASQVIC